MHKLFGETTGTCSVCDINLWSTCDGKPAIFPCGVKGCPYETEEEQSKIELKGVFSEHGSSLQQLIESSE
jgi:hypothetical protein